MSDPDPTVQSMIVGKIEALDRSLNRRLDDSERNTERRLDAQDATLARIERQTTATNGRVTTLEKARERAQGVMSAYSWVPGVMAAILGAGLTILIMALSGGIHL